MFNLLNLFRSRRSPDVLLKEATERKKAGDLDGAISTLRRAYKGISRTPAVYPVATFLRLPLYLQAAGRSQEAWLEFQRLLQYGYPNQIQSSKHIDIWQVYDKMRLFLEREGNPAEAAKYSVFTYISQCEAEREQDELREFKQMTSKSAVTMLVDGVWGDRDKLVRTRLTDLIMRHLHALPRTEIERLGREIDGILA